MNDLEVWQYPALLKTGYLLARSKMIIALGLGVFTILIFAAWQIMSLASTPSWFRVSFLGVVWLFDLACALSLLIYLRPWISLPLGIAVSADGVQLLDQQRSYASIPLQEIMVVRQRRFSVLELPFFNPFVGEVTEVRCNAPVSRFYILPTLTDYSRFVSTLDSLLRKPEVPAHSSFQVNRVSFGLALTVILLVCAGAVYIWKRESGASYMPLIVLMFSFVALVLLLFSSPLTINIDPTGVSFRYLAYTRRIPKESLRGFVAYNERWAGDYYKVLRHSKGKVYIHRCYYDQYEQMTQALERLMVSNKSSSR